MKSIKINSLKQLPAKNKTRVWLITNDGSILLSNNKSLNAKLSDLTLEADNLEDLMIKIENEWGILASEDDLKLEYFEADKKRKKDKNIDIYFLELGLTKEEKAFVSNRFNGKFYNMKKASFILKAKLNKDFKKSNIFSDMLSSTIMHKHGL